MNIENRVLRIANRSLVLLGVCFLLEHGYSLVGNMKEESIERWPMLEQYSFGITNSIFMGNLPNLINPYSTPLPNLTDIEKIFFEEKYHNLLYKGKSTVSTNLDCKI